VNILKELHREHSTVSFGKDYEEEESQIQIQTRGIQKLFKKIIQSMSYFHGDELFEQTQGFIFSKIKFFQVLQIKKNMKLNLNSQLNELSNEFKEDQKLYIQSKIFQKFLQFKN
jgi:ABC-type lipoprotein export system ATPase subunit